MDSPSIQLDNVQYSVPDGTVSRVVLSQVSLAVAESTTLALVGPSGSGKTTLLNLIAGRINPELGEVRVKTGSKIIFLKQDPGFVPYMTAIENVELAQDLNGSSRAVAPAIELMQLLDISERRESLPDTMSGGERQRLALARALASGGDVLLADEPTASLDEDASKHIASVLGRIPTTFGATVVTATHDPLVAAAMDQTIALRHP